MSITGHFHNGVIVPSEQLVLPEGAAVEIHVPKPEAKQSPPADEMTEEQRAKLLAALAEIDAIPNENPGDTFSGADHDEVLYGEEALYGNLRDDLR